MVASNFPNRPFRLEGSSWLGSQNISANTSYVGADLWIRKNSYSPTYSLSAASSFSFYVNGSLAAGWSFGYDFRSANEMRLCYVEATIGHNADGTKTYPFDGYANVNIMGYTEIHGSVGLPTIPRASQATWASGGNAIAGVAKTLNMNRASSAFTHNVDYTLGSVSARALTNIGASGDWTPPITLLNEMPNTAIMAGTFRTYTYNGGSLIGSTTSYFNLEPAADIVPTWTSATVEHSTASPAQINIKNLIGAGKYLQTLSGITCTITGAAGVYGSTISAYEQRGAGAQVAALPTVTLQPPLTSGTYPVTQTITDSRGRKKTQTTNIDVLPYARPVMSSVALARCDVNGVVSSSGTYLKVTPLGAVQSVINGTERNTLTLKVTWTPQPSGTGGTVTPISGSSTLVANTPVVVTGPFDVAKSYSVVVEISDAFGQATTATKTIGTGEVFQHWGTGLAVGKYWEKGMLDVFGDAYASGGMLSLGKRVTNANLAIQEGRYHMNGGTNAPPPGPDGNATAQITIDVETWYDVQGSTTYHYVRQRARWFGTGTVPRASRRNLVNSFGLGYSMSRVGVYNAAYPGNGFLFTDWQTEDPSYMQPASTAGPTNSTFDYVSNKVILGTNARYIDLHGVFASDATAHRVDYYYRTGDNQNNFFQLKTGTGAVPAGITYTSQSMYISGTGTPAGVLDNNLAQAQIGRGNTEVHSGHIIFYNLNVNGMPKTWTGMEAGASAGAVVTHGGVVGGTGADNTQFTGFRLSTWSAANNFTHGWIRVTALF